MSEPLTFPAFGLETLAVLNALSGATREDGVGIQILIRPAEQGWSKVATDIADGMRKNKGKKNFFY